MEWNQRTPGFLKALNIRVLPVLCRRFYSKGLMPIEIKRLTRDILNIIGHGGFYNADIINQKLERLGWGKNIVDNYIFELLLYYLESDKCPDCFNVSSKMIELYNAKPNIFPLFDKKDLLSSILSTHNRSTWNIKNEVLG